MKKIVFILIALIAIRTAFGQKADRESRNVPVFHGVEVSGGVDLYIRSGSPSVEVSAADADIRRHMVTEVIGGILRIHLENKWNPGSRDPKMKAYVSVSELNKLEASGGGHVYIEGEITSDDMSILLSGGGNLEGRLNAQQLNISQSGGSNVDLKGKVKSLKLNASGGGSLQGYDLVTDYASIEASGGSSSELTVNKEIHAVISGGGSVDYKGTAVVTGIRSSGGGSINHKD